MEIFRGHFTWRSVLNDVKDKIIKMAQVLKTEVYLRISENDKFFIKRELATD